MTYKILLIEDEELHLELLCRHLKREKTATGEDLFDVTPCKDLSSALKAWSLSLEADNEKFDLVLMDYLTPVGAIEKLPVEVPENIQILFAKRKFAGKEIAGWQLVWQILYSAPRGQRPVPIIIMSGTDFLWDENKEELRSAYEVVDSKIGALLKEVGLIAKPFRMEKLLPLVYEKLGIERIINGVKATPHPPGETGPAQGTGPGFPHP